MSVTGLAPDRQTPQFKQMLTVDRDLQRGLIRAYQYVVARYDIDGFRIDTLRYLNGNLPQIFGNALREFSSSSTPTRCVVPMVD
jgi:glycosidase